MALSCSLADGVTSAAADVCKPEAIPFASASASPFCYRGSAAWASPTPLCVVTSCQIQPTGDVTMVPYGGDGTSIGPACAAPCPNGQSGWTDPPATPFVPFATSVMCAGNYYAVRKDKGCASGWTAAGYLPNYPGATAGEQYFAGCVGPSDPALSQSVPTPTTSSTTTSEETGSVNVLANAPKDVSAPQAAVDTGVPLGSLQTTTTTSHSGKIIAVASYTPSGAPTKPLAARALSLLALALLSRAVVLCI